MDFVVNSTQHRRKLSRKLSRNLSSKLREQLTNQETTTKKSHPIKIKETRVSGPTGDKFHEKSPTIGKSLFYYTLFLDFLEFRSCRASKGDAFFSFFVEGLWERT